MEELTGGRKGRVFRLDDKVVRPAGPWSSTVHALLEHLVESQFLCAPRTFGFDGVGNEILSFVEGSVYNYPLEGPIASETALMSAAALLRRYHDATVSFLKKKACRCGVWMLPPRRSPEVICHGDYSPYNVTLQGEQTVGMIDFDTAHPGPRIWDIAYAVYCFAPFKTCPDDALGDLGAQFNRARLFCDAYGLSLSERKQLVQTMIYRVQTLVDYMLTEALRGNQVFAENIKEGHHLSYLDDVRYLKTNATAITDGLLDGVGPRVNA